jgi:hypothetical protein
MSRASKAGRPPAKHRRVVCYITPELFAAIRHEAIDRDMTTGALIEEAFYSRVTMTSRKATQ